MIAIQTSFAGDSVLTLPFLYRLLKNEECRRLDLVVAPRNEAIFKLAFERGLSFAQDRVKLIRYDKKKDSSLFAIKKFAEETLEPHASKVFCLQRSFRSGLIAFFSQAQERIGFGSGSASFLYTKMVPRSWSDGVHEIEKNLNLLRSAFGTCQSWISDESPSLLSSSYNGERQEKKYDLCIALGSPWLTKRWPLNHVEKVIEWADSKKLSILLVGDQEAAEWSRDYRNTWRANVTDLCGQSNVQEWIDLVGTSRFVLSGDSATLHVASDARIPTLALFGPTVPGFGFYPWRSQGEVLEKELSCRPCDIHGAKKCPLKHHQCMEDLSPELVQLALDKFFFKSF